MPAGAGAACTLVPADRVAAVKEAWEKEYYSKRDLTPEQREGAVVVEPTRQRKRRTWWKVALWRDVDSA